MLVVRRHRQFPESIQVPGDKSISHRAAMFAGLAEGETVVSGFLPSEDCLCSLRAMEALGAVARPLREEPGLGLVEIAVTGTGMRPRQPAGPVDCGNSGTTMRLLSGILAGQGFETTLFGDESLSKRPMKRVADPLGLMGARVTGQGEKISAPITIHGAGSALKAIRYELPVASAQVKSAVLLAGLFAPGETTVVEPVATRNHTERIMSHFGIEWRREGSEISVRSGQVPRARDLVVPGDISSAAFWMVAAAAAGVELRLPNTGLNNTRNGVIAVLRRMGAVIDAEPAASSLDGEPAGEVVARGGRLRGTVIAGDEIPNVIDELPVLAVAGALAEGRTVIRDAAELRVKETDRIAVVAENLRRMGVRVTEFDDGMEIEGGAALTGAEIPTHHDHRIAMAFAIAGLFAQGETRILGEECIRTSYPNFLEHLGWFQ
jgi:3-phosphoshikimate 1-carboxyvinyltransferase